ncbi:MAG: hypothetical protein V1903_12495 [Bacteroidota bacterium]
MSSPARKRMRWIIATAFVIAAAALLLVNCSGPSSIAGAFQNLQSREGFSLTGGAEAPLPEFYADAAVSFLTVNRDIKI